MARPSLKRVTSDHNRDDDLLRPEITAAFVKGRKNYETRRIKVELKKQEIIVSRQRICRLMREENL